MSYIVVAFYTINTPYEDEVRNLIKDCRSHGVDIITKGYIPRGKWVYNAGIKPEFLMEMLRQHPDKSIVYLDADARMRKKPELFDALCKEDVDIAVHYRRDRELLSGTIFLNNTVETRRLVSEWIKAQKLQPGTWDQRTLQKLVETRKDLKLRRLPAAYTQIFDSMRHHGEPVIEHMQASRKYKNIVKNTKIRYSDLKQLPVHVRHNTNGSVWIPRRNANTEKFLDQHLERAKDRELTWVPRIKHMHNVAQLKDQYKGRTCTIVGKGPSLDNLISYDFESSDDPVIAINHSIIKVEEVIPKTYINKKNLYMMQQDTFRCPPKHAIPILRRSIQYFYPVHQTRYIYNGKLVGKQNSITVLQAIYIAKMMGCNKVRLVSFDACTNGNTGYANATGVSVRMTSQGGAERFLGHRKRIVKLCQQLQLTLEWFTPDHRSSEAAGTPRPLLDSH